MRRKIFVFGSNQAGIHGAGSALEARQRHGAIRGQGEGLQGNSYAIPTKDKALRPLTLAEIECAVQRFFDIAWRNPTWQFHVVPIGCGRAGYTPEQIAPLFKFAPGNVVLPLSFEVVLDKEPALM
jgi:hypothetical protein